MSLNQILIYIFFKSCTYRNRQEREIKGDKPRLGELQQYVKVLKKHTKASLTKSRKRVPYKTTDLKHKNGLTNYNRDVVDPS